MFREEQQQELALLTKLNGFAAVEYPDDPAMRARIKSYELAYRMQATVPDAVDFGAETQATQKLYGLDAPATQTFGRQCLAARRMVERGVRFIEVSCAGGIRFVSPWDQHEDLVEMHAKNARIVDQRAEIDLSRQTLDVLTLLMEELEGNAVLMRKLKRKLAGFDAARTQARHDKSTHP